MLKITVDTADLDRKLNAVGQALDDPAEVLNDVGVYLLGEVRLNFEELSKRGTGVDGTKWRELDPETEKKKARKGGWKGKGDPPKSQIGVDTGLLRNSSVPGFKGDGEGGNLLEVDLQSASVTVGFARSYAKFFDKDRPLIPTEAPKDWVEGAEEIVGDWLQEKLEPLEGTG